MARVVVCLFQITTPVEKTKRAQRRLLPKRNQKPKHTKQVLAPLGADVKGSVCLEPDGRFPNHIPNPEAKEAMDSGIAAVKAAGEENADGGWLWGV
jgi:hypothetical protein